MRSIRFDISPPIVLIRHPREFEVEEFRKLAATLREKLVEGERCALLVDLRDVDPLGAGAQVRKEAAEILKESTDFLEKVAVCEARVTSGPLLRGILTVIDWLAPRPWPVKNFTKGEMAENWLRAQLLKHGLTAPEAPIWVGGDFRASG